jgi:phosphoglycolate phosphatase
MMIKVIAFDFDGTIADTHDALLEITNRLSSEFGYQPVDQEKLWEFKNLSSREIVKNSQISILKIPFFLKRIKSELADKIEELKPIANIESSLKTIYSQGYSLGIITSNNQENVIKFLSKNNLINLFEFIYSGTSLFGKDKVIRKFLNRNKLQPEQVVYVGDETRDIEAAQKNKIKIIAVSWGFNTAAVLARHKPDYLIDTPQELITVIESWQTNQPDICSSIELN